MMTVGVGRSRGYATLKCIGSISIFFLNVFQDAYSHFGHEMLSWVRLREINAHSVSPQPAS